MPQCEPRAMPWAIGVRAVGTFQKTPQRGDKNAPTGQTVIPQGDALGHNKANLPTNHATPLGQSIRNDRGNDQSNNAQYPGDQVRDS